MLSNLLKLINYSNYLQYLQDSIKHLDVVGNIRKRFETFEEYVENFWFKKIGPALFSVHWEPHRTNITVES